MLAGLWLLEACWAPPAACETQNIRSEPQAAALAATPLRVLQSACSAAEGGTAMFPRLWKAAERFNMFGTRGQCVLRRGAAA